ncbi:MAG: sodium:alanine symporter family protein, partial [Clostridia bacterium]|nr:sodium:alanine symporter family protein [Clostridia bacterium]
RLGVVRGILSNEAGCGTAPMAHAAASTERGSAQGALGMVEVAFDTLLLCSLTGLALLVYPPAMAENNGISMILSVFSSVFGRASTILVPLSILLFAFATLLCWCYYGRQCVCFLTRKRIPLLLFDLLFLLTLLFSPLLCEEQILSLCDPVISTMTLFNLAALFLHRKEIKYTP